MGFVDRELERVVTKLQAGPLADGERSQLYAVQQALLWALEPESYMSPFNMLAPIDIPEAPEGCQAKSGHSQFSDSLDLHVS